MGKLTITIPDELLERFEKWCKENSWKKSTIIQILIRDLVEGHLEIGVRKKG